MAKETPFRLLTNEEFNRLPSLEKMDYLRKASEYLASLLRGPAYAGPERRQPRPDLHYTGRERRSAA